MRKSVLKKSLPVFCVSAAIAAAVSGCGMPLTKNILGARISSYIIDDPSALSAVSLIDKETQKEIAELMSTDETAMAMDFRWFTNEVYSLSDGEDVSAIDPRTTVRIGGEEPFLLNGGWKCYICGGETEYIIDHERYLNAVIDTDGDYFNITLNRWIYFDSAQGSSVEEEGSVEATGKWNDEKASAHAEADTVVIDLTDFYLTKEKGIEYAMGRIMWENGEVDHIGLMRVDPSAAALTEGGSGEDAEDQIEMMVERAKKKTGAPEAEIEWKDDNTLTIHLYEIVQEPDGTEHSSTWDWYTIDVNTMKGWDFFDNPIDLGK